MGCVQQAVLEFDEEIPAPWRPRLVAEPVADGDAPVRARRPHPSRRSPSRVGACRPPEVPARPSPTRPSGAAPVRPGGIAGARAVRPSSRPGGRPAQRRRPAPGAPARLRLTRRARRLVVVLALAGGVSVVAVTGSLLGSDSGGLHLAGKSSVVVESGDTLWSIASSLGDDTDVRAQIDEIQRINGLESADLVPGQVLVLP